VNLVAIIIVIDNYDGKLKRIALAEDTASGRVMEVYSTEPGVQCVHKLFGWYIKG
jgi:hypothetical protein